MQSKPLSYPDSQPAQLPSGVKKPVSCTKIIIFRFIAENVLLIFLQYLGVMLNAMSQQSLPVSFIAASACGFIFLRGTRILPGIWLGTFLGYAEISTVQVALWSASSLTVLALSLLLICQRANIASPIFIHKHKFVHYTIISILLTLCMSYILNIHTRDNLQKDWFTYFNSLLILTPAIVSWDYYYPSIQGKILSIVKKFFPILFLQMMTAYLLCMITTTSLFLSIMGAHYLIMVLVSTRLGIKATLSFNASFSIILSLMIYILSGNFSNVALLSGAVSITAWVSMMLSFYKK